MAGSANIANDSQLSLTPARPATPLSPTPQAEFHNGSTAGSAIITNSSEQHPEFLRHQQRPATPSSGNTNGTTLNFNDTSTAANARITNNATVNFRTTARPATQPSPTAPILNFRDSSTAGSATIINSGTLHFSGNSTAGTATITNSVLDRDLQFQ